MTRDRFQIPPEQRGGREGVLRRTDAPAVAEFAERRDRRVDQLGARVQRAQPQANIRQEPLRPRPPTPIVGAIEGPQHPPTPLRRVRTLADQHREAGEPGVGPGRARGFPLDRQRRAQRPVALRQPAAQEPAPRHRIGDPHREVRLASLRGAVESGTNVGCLGVEPTQARVLVSATQPRLGPLGEFRVEDVVLQANLRIALASVGLDFSHVVQIRTHIVDHDADKLAVVARLIGEIWGDRPPTQTLTGVAALALPDMRFEIDAVAVTE